MKIGLLSDTHSYIDERILFHLENCDEIWHAGDIGDLHVTDTLKKLKPLRGVYGNIDNHLARLEFPLVNKFEVEGVKVYMIHIGGKPSKYAKGISKDLLDFRPKIFICGHSHICKVQMDHKYGCLYINPGAAGNHGFHKVRTLMRFDLLDGKIENLELIELAKRG